MKQLTPPDISHVNDKTWAYIAGFLDGEGCLGVYCVGKYRNFQYRIVATQADPTVLFWIRDQIGGAIREKPLSLTRSKHLSYLWGIYQRQHVIQVLHKLIPYLIVKRNQAEAMVRYRANEALVREVSRLKQENYALR